jgi:hypothetical protein
LFCQKHAGILYSLVAGSINEIVQRLIMKVGIKLWTSFYLFSVSIDYNSLRIFMLYCMKQMFSLLYDVYVLVYFEGFHPSGLGTISGGEVGSGGFL